MRSIEVRRRLGEADVAAVCELLHVAAIADGHLALGDHQWIDLVQGGREGFAGFVATETGHPHPVGYAQLSRGRDSWSVEYVVDPHHRAEEEQAIGTELLRAALAEVGRLGGGHVHLWVPKPRTVQDELLLRLGFSRGRALFQMRRPLPADPPPPELRTRPFRPGVDEDAWLELNNRAFDWHPEQGGWTKETLAAREAEPWFDPEGFLLTEEQGRLVGFCWTKVHASADPALGEIYVIATDPDVRGRGLGRALVLAGLAHLAGRGLRVGMLYVDATNAPALRLYQDLGFAVDHVDRAYVIDVPRTGTTTQA